MRSSGWTHIQYDWCPYKKGKLGQRQTCTLGECHVMIEAEIGVIFYKQGVPKMAGKPPEAKGEAWGSTFLWSSEGTNPGDTLILDFRPPEL